MVGEANAKSVEFVEALEASLKTIVVHLSKAPIDPNVDTLLLSAITEANFFGYEPVTLEFEPCEVPDDEWAEIASQEPIFEADEITTQQVIYFAYVTCTPVGGITDLVQIYEFPEPVLVNTQGQQVSTGPWRFKQIPETF